MWAIFCLQECQELFKQNRVFCRTQENLLKSLNPWLLPIPKDVFIIFCFLKGRMVPLLSSLKNLFLDSLFYQEYLTTYIPLSRFSINLFLYFFQEQTSQLKLIRVDTKNLQLTSYLMVEKLEIFQLKSNTKQDQHPSHYPFQHDTRSFNVVR